jgi:hypothetical protein
MDRASRPPLKTLPFCLLLLPWLLLQWCAAGALAGQKLPQPADKKSPKDNEPFPARIELRASPPSIQPLEGSDPPKPPAEASPDAQRSPLSVWIDLRPPAPGAPPQTVPAWVEAIECLGQQAVSGKASASHATETPGAGAGLKTVFRIRVNRPVTAARELQARVFFDDPSTGLRPQISAWDELGGELLPTHALGEGLDLPSSETMVVAIKNTGYVEIAAPGDGAQVRGLFLTWIKQTIVRQPVDFPVERPMSEPFHILSSKRVRENDDYLYGVVTASLAAGPLKLKAPDAPAATFEFNLEKQPLLAVVTFEVLGATISAPPAVSVNERIVGNADFFLPDLADPAYRGEARELEMGMAFRYTGWLRAQKVIPGGLLTGGLNNLAIQLSYGSEAVAVRAVEIQLKYNWEKLDYILTPAPPSAPVTP